MSWIANVNGIATGSDDCLHYCVNCPQAYWMGWDTCPNCGTSKNASPPTAKKDEENKDDRTNQAR